MDFTGAEPVWTNRRRLELRASRP